VIARRVLLGAALLTWVGMLGALGYRENARKDDAQQKYIEALFGKDAPVLVSKSIWLRDGMTGEERHLGFMEMQITRFAGRDVHVKHTATVSLGKLPLSARIAVKPFIESALGKGPLGELEAELNVYVNRRYGLRKVNGKLMYAERKFEFIGIPRGGKYLRVTSWSPGRSSTNLVAFDRRRPFGTGSSAFLSMRDLKVGSSWSVNYFDPVSKQSSARMIRVVRKEMKKYKRKMVECFYMTAHPVAGTGSAGAAGAYGAAVSEGWVSVKDGKLIREETSFVIFKLALVLEDSVTAEERNYRKRLESPLEAKKKDAKKKDAK
jgi:hypothetical protein